MPDHVLCSCGRSLQVVAQNAGKVVRCPDCGLKIRLPPLKNASPQQRSAKHACPKCGSGLRVSAELVGRRVRCAACRQQLVVADHPLRLLPPDVQSDEVQEAKELAGESAREEAPDDRGPPFVESRSWAVEPPPPPQETPGNLPPQEMATSHETCASPPPLPGTGGELIARRGPEEHRELGTSIGAGGPVVPDMVLGPLARSMSWRKILFFTAGLISLAALGAAVLFLAVEGGNWQSALLLGGAFVIFTIGMLGVLAGGVAYMYHRETEGRICTVGAATQFCARRFGALFAFPIIIVVTLAIVSALFNSLIGVLNGSSGSGSLLAGLLWLPQILVNLALWFMMLAIVVGLCAIATEDIGLGKALSRYDTCLRRHTGSLLAQTMVAYLVSALLFGLVPLLLYWPLSHTIVSNAPRFEMFSSLDNLVGGRQEPDNPSYTDRLASGFADQIRMASPSTASWSPEEPSHAGFDTAGIVVRAASLVVLALAVLAVPCVYWCCAFTSYYENVFALQTLPDLTSYQNRIPRLGRTSSRRP